MKNGNRVGRGASISEAGSGPRDVVDAPPGRTTEEAVRPGLAGLCPTAPHRV